MRTRAGEIVEYEGCTELVYGVYLDDEGAIYIHDGESEVCCWVYDEIVEDPDAFIAAVTAVAIAAKLGANAVRRNITDKGTTLRGLLRRTEAVTQGGFGASNNK